MYQNTRVYLGLRPSPRPSSASSRIDRAPKVMSSESTDTAPDVFSNGFCNVGTVTLANNSPMLKSPALGSLGSRDG